MEGLIIFLVVAAIFFLPLVLAIMAMIRTTRMQSAIDSLNVEIRSLRRQIAPPAKAEGQPSPAPSPAPKPSPPSVRPPPPPPAPSAPPAPSVFPEPLRIMTESAPGGSGFEIALGGKVASFVGIAVLVMGIVFFVGYAIQHQWIGPGLRVILGLLTGGLLVGAGYVAEIRGKNLRVLARALTGGGAALFYFSVFAAHGIYHLIGAVWAGVGLAVCASSILALSVVYNSQVVAVLGVLGAFIMPLLIGGSFEKGIFPMAFIAAVNAPVILLGLRQKWQWLYNLAFLFTILLATVWLDAVLPGQWLIGLCFSVLFFAEFVALGLLKLKSEANTQGRTLDIIRLLASSLALMGAVYAILNEAKLDDWMGTAFLATAVLHLVPAKIGWTWLPRFKQEIMALLIGALSFATLALPAQLDGVWVSLGWALEGVILAWFALRIRSRLLQVGAVALGILGLVKALSYDITLYTETPPLFLNGRFAVGLASAALLGVQGWLQGRFKPISENDADTGRQLLIAAALLAALATLFADSFTALPSTDPWPWLMTSVGMLAAGFFALCFRRDVWVERLGVLLLGLLPLKVMIFDVLLSWDYCGRVFDPFVNTVFWTQALLVLVVLIWVIRSDSSGALIRGKGLNLAQIISIVSLLSGIALVSAEIARLKGDWPMPLISIWWAACALALAVTGLLRRRAHLRYLALFLFAATLFKIFTVDLEGIKGLQRIAAFVGVGALLLALSFAYQKVAPLLLRPKELPHE